MSSYKTETLTLVRGDSSDLFKISVENIPLLDNNWTCKMDICEKTGETPLISKPINKSSDNTFFVGGISPTDSDLLIAKMYYLIFTIYNPVVEFRREVRYILTISDGWVD